MWWCYIVGVRLVGEGGFRGVGFQWLPQLLLYLQCLKLVGLDESSRCSYYLLVVPILKRFGLLLILDFVCFLGCLLFAKDVGLRLFSVLGISIGGQMRFVCGMCMLFPQACLLCP